jgi:hypothetical protein
MKRLDDFARCNFTNKNSVCEIYYNPLLASPASEGRTIKVWRLGF